MIGEKRPLQKYKDIDATEMVLLARLILDNNETPDEKRCKYCHAPYMPILEGNDFKLSYGDGGELIVKFKKAGGECIMPVNYCLYCGRKLGKD